MLLFHVASIKLRNSHVPGEKGKFLTGEVYNVAQQFRITPLYFQGVALLRGDFVAMRTRTLPLPEVQAAVMEVKDGVLDVFSTMLAIFQHNGLFTEDEVIEIKVVYPAAEAIPRESRGKNFAQHERVAAVINGTRYEGRVVAACDGIIAVHTDDGQTFSSGASHLNPV